jgi:prolyl 4-hydroxylase
VLPPAVPVPEPLPHGPRTTIWAHDRDVQVLVTMNSPRVIVFGDLLSAQECDEMIALARTRLARSETVQTETGASEINEARTSQGMFFERGEHPVVSRIEARMAALMAWPLENGEGLQVLRYGPGAEYKPHYDYFDPAHSGTPSILKRGGQRVASLVCYLNTPAQGGATVFPDVQLDVAPLRGNAVFFSYDRAHPATKSLHGGAPVVEGEKWVATKWVREGRFV